MTFFTLVLLTCMSKAIQFAKVKGAILVLSAQGPFIQMVRNNRKFRYVSFEL